IIVVEHLVDRGVIIEGAVIVLKTGPCAALEGRYPTRQQDTREYVDMDSVSGRRTWKMISNGAGPNMRHYLVMSCILLFGGAVLTAAGLDFIGLGPSDGVSLGLMLQNSVEWSASQLGMWWWFVPPGLAITTIVGAMYILNVGLDEVFNPKLREL